MVTFPSTIYRTGQGTMRLLTWYRARNAVGPQYLILKDWMKPLESRRLCVVWPWMGALSGCPRILWRQFAVASLPGGCHQQVRYMNFHLDSHPQQGASVFFAEGEFGLCPSASHIPHQLTGQPCMFSVSAFVSQVSSRMKSCHGQTREVRLAQWGRHGWNRMNRIGEDAGSFQSPD